MPKDRYATQHAIFIVESIENFKTNPIDVLVKSISLMTFLLDLWEKFEMNGNCRLEWLQLIALNKHFPRKLNLTNPTILFHFSNWFQSNDKNTQSDMCVSLFFSTFHFLLISIAIDWHENPELLINQFQSTISRRQCKKMSFWELFEWGCLMVRDNANVCVLHVISRIDGGFWNALLIIVGGEGLNFSIVIVLSQENPISIAIFRKIIKIRLNLIFTQCLEGVK